MLNKFKINKYVKLAIKLIFTATALYLVFTKIDLRLVIDIYKNSKLLLIFSALILFIISQLLSSFRLNTFFKKIDVHISELSNFKLYLLGMFYNLFLPGGIGGDGYKIFLLNKNFKTKVKKLFWALVLDRGSGLVALLCLAAFLFVFTNFTGEIKYWFILIIPASIVSFYFLLKFFFTDYVKSFPRFMTFSFFVQLAQVICAMLILIAFGQEDKYTEYLFLFLISSIAASLPLTIGGIGAREITFLYGAEILHLEINTSIALSLMFYIITALVSFAGIYFSFAKKILHR
ncbi:MAG: flippase-like domain-containing protein [Bacteroidales bacterium]|nr:flippase-like domain-containing protein [Bacteroidales bacterium]